MNEVVSISITVGRGRTIIGRLPSFTPDADIQEVRLECPGNTTLDTSLMYEGCNVVVYIEYNKGKEQWKTMSFPRNFTGNLCNLMEGGIFYQGTLGPWERKEAPDRYVYPDSRGNDSTVCAACGVLFMGHDYPCTRPRAHWPEPPKQG